MAAKNVATSDIIHDGKKIASHGDKVAKNKFKDDEYQSLVDAGVLVTQGEYASNYPTLVDDNDEDDDGTEDVLTAEEAAAKKQPTTNADGSTNK